MKSKHPFLIVLAGILILFLLAFLLFLRGEVRPLAVLIAFSLLGVFLLAPFLLTCLNLMYCFRHCEKGKSRRTALIVEIFTLMLGILLSLLLAFFSDTKFTADWMVPLVNNQIHAPVWTPAWPALLFFLCLGILGYGILRSIPLKRMPPLIIVLGITAMGSGMVICILWILQVFVLDNIECLLCLLPFNWIVIGIKVIREKASDWKEMEEQEKRRFSHPFLESLNQKVMDSASWPFYAFLLFWPMAGLCLIVLALFGQRPDNLIRAWTETSDWNLSTRISPPNVLYDDHYLCTVAAGGHRSFVKPVRMGIRLGHPIVVNRQLCIANAFEQVLMERLPGFHRRIRNFYDTWGFPVARQIRFPYQADLIYMLMKPLEWMFLAILYLTDARPEDRIWMQYIPPVPSQWGTSDQLLANPSANVMGDKY